MMSYPMHSNIKDKYTGERIVYEEEVARHTLSVIEKIPLSEVKAFDKPDIIIGNIGIEVVSAVPEELSKLFDLQDKQHFKGIDNKAKIQECANKLHATVTPYFITHQPVCISEDTKLSETPYQTVVDAYDKKIAKLQKGQYEKMDEYHLFIYTHYNIDSSLIQKQLLDVLYDKYNNTSGLKYDIVYIFSAEEVLCCDLKNHKLENIKINSTEIANEAWNDIERRMTLENLIQRYCPDGVEYKPLWEVSRWDKKFKDVSKEKQKNTESFNHISAEELKALECDGDVMLLSTGKYNGYTSVEKAGDALNKGEVLAIPSGGTANIKYVNGLFVDSGNILATTNQCTKFIYYVLQNKLNLIASFFRGSGIKHPSMGDIIDIEIPIPPLPVQEEIVRILDKFTELETELETELGLRKQQYEYYRDKMLSLEDYDGEVEWTTLGEACNVQAGGTPSTKNPEFWGGDIKWLASTVCNNKKTVDEVSKYVTEAGLKKSRMMKTGTTLIALVGATIGKIAFLPFDAAINQNIAGIYPKNDKIVSPDFVYHYCSTYYPKFLELGEGKFAMANMTFVRNLPFPILKNYDNQIKIASVLDKFSTLVEDISEGLPAEIKLRKKQYEYYRDKLLNFKKLEVV